MDLLLTVLGCIAMHYLMKLVGAFLQIRRENIEWEKEKKPGAYCEWPRKWAA